MDEHVLQKQLRRILAAIAAAIMDYPIDQRFPVHQPFYDFRKCN